LSLLIVPAVVLASSGHVDGEVTRYFTQTGRENDFWPRVINFSIFVGILAYLLFSPIKAFFQGRSEEIAGRLDEIEAKLQSAKDEKKEAQNRLDVSEKKAEEILVDAKAEAVILSEKIILANENELLLMDKQLEEKISLEERRTAREAIDEVLSENINNADIMLDETKVVEIISKKVA
jgi:F-type H+-transporting ATPase subunit b